MRRRSLLRGAGAGVAGLAATSIVGCGDDDDDSSPTAASQGTAPASGASPAATTAAQPRKGGTFRIASSVPTPLDIMTTSSGGPREFGGGFYPTLIQPKGARWENFPAREYQPNLASLPEVPDPLTYTFKVDSKANWGAPLNRPVSSADVIWSLDRFLGRNGQAPSPQAAELAAVESYNAPDDRTVTLKLSRPSAALIIKLSSDYSLGIMPQETGKAFDQTKTVVSAGPWLLDKYEPPTSYRLIPNPKWHLGPDKPYLAAIEATNVPEYATQLTQFRGGNLDWMGSVLPGDIAGVLSDRQGTQLRPQKGLALTFLAFGEPRDGKAPWADDRVRKAISLLIDRDSIIPVVYDTERFKTFPPNVETGTGGPLDPNKLISWHNVLPAGFPGQSIDPRTDPQGTGKYIKFSIAEAKSLLSAAGHPDGIEIEMHYTSGFSRALQQEAEMLIPMLKAGGITVKPMLEDIASYLRSTFAGNFNGMGMMLQGYTEHSEFLTALYNTKGGRNQSRVEDAAISAEVAKIEQELDATKRFAMTKAIQPKLADKMWYVPTVGWQVRWDVAAPKLHNIYDYQTYRGGNLTVERANLWYDA